MTHFVSASCEGERCGWRVYVVNPLPPRGGFVRCGAPATHKIGEEIPADDPEQMRHNLTQYVCCRHFTMIMGDATACPT